MTKSKNNKKPSNSYSQYSGIATQLIALLFLSIWLGKKMDAKWGGENQYFTALLLISVLAVFFYKLYIDLERERND